MTIVRTISLALSHEDIYFTCHTGILWLFLIIFKLINNLYLCPLGISVYVQTAEPTDFQNVSGISFLPANFTIDEDNFSSITENSLVVLDDFSFKLANNKQAKINFLKVVNYILQHKTITLILVIHNLFSNNLSNDILCTHHVFLSYSNLGYLIMSWYYILYFYKCVCVCIVNITYVIFFLWNTVNFCELFQK